ncbi:MAG: PaaI family thioesterase [Actinobacteria bacterium]|nr:PaaI family thioesterase [Actinomycetota bacterium]MBU1942191.1 PaaI family thioesterase [Actinomycetota bacterium]MBU2688044.1 PaaI family thioesterase [Actinomycetota bacterium]
MTGGRGPVAWEAAGPEEEDRYREIIRDRVENSPFYQHMGLRVTGLGPGRATFEMPAGRHLWNVGGIVHGGAITSIADAAAGVALATVLDARTERPVTIELKLNFCAPVREGTLEARGRVVQKGKRIAVSDVEVTEGERLIAKGLATYMIIASGTAADAEGPAT